jgi:hypothetical protein
LSASAAHNVTSILPYLKKAAEDGFVFDDLVTQAMDDAFDAVRKQLHDKGQPSIGYEIIAKRIIESAKKGESDPSRLCEAGLAALGIRRDA